MQVANPTPAWSPLLWLPAVCAALNHAGPTSDPHSCLLDACAAPQEGWGSQSGDGELQALQSDLSRLKAELQVC